jgi:hypothetical protein
LTAAPREVQIEEDDIWTRDLAGIHLFDVVEHLLAVAMTGERRIDVVIGQRLTNDKNVAGVIFDNYYFELPPAASSG